jgi:hypothetical protein
MWWLSPTIPATQEVKIGRIVIKTNPSKKLARPHPMSTNKPGMMACTCDPNYMGGKGVKIMVQSWLDKNKRP